MNHPAIDPEAVSRLKRRLDRSSPAEALPADTTTSTASTGPAETRGSLDKPGIAGAGAGASASAKAKAVAVARRVTVPLVARVRHELDRAVARELEALRTEIDQLRREVARTRAEHAAAIAALQEERQAR